MTMRLLAGDLGGTKCNLGVYEVVEEGSYRLLHSGSYASKDYPHLRDILRDFLEGAGSPVDAAAMGVPGPVYRGRADLVNLSWSLDAAELRPLVDGRPFQLMNDLEAFAWGIPGLSEEELVCLHGALPPPRDAGAAVIAPGTGLGVAYMAWDGATQLPVGTEAGHTDLAPASEEEVRLLRFLQRRLEDRVCWEDVLSGPGLGNLYAFRLDETGAAEHPAVTAAREGGDPNAEIARLGLEDEDPQACEALALFVRLLGSEAGNHALRVVARGGIFLAGGIPRKILPALRDPAFLEALWDKAHYGAMLREFPVAVVQDDHAAVDGALRVAHALAEDRRP